MLALRRLVVGTCLVVCSCPNLGVASTPDATAAAQPRTAAIGPAPLLFSQPDAAPLEIQLTGAWRTIARDRTPEPAYYPAQLEFPGMAQLAIKVKPRGKSRRRPDFCKFPPLWLNLPKKSLSGSALAGQNKLKLVTHCARLGNNSKAANDRLWSEYLLYRMFNLVTDRSFRVQPVRITYHHSASNESFQHPGFLIEHKQQLARRLQAKVERQDKFRIAELDQTQAALASLFFYFAGGTDYSLIRSASADECCHNTVPLRSAAGQIVAVPYDFDATGFVNPPYSAPQPSLKIKRLTQRLYRGFCQFTPAHTAAMQRFFDAKQDIDNLIAGHSQLSESKRRKLQRFTSKFWNRLPNVAQGTTWLGKNCR